MRPYLLTGDMDFRVIPSAIPLQSPSPDNKNVNIITPTISPNTIEIKKNSTPIKNLRIQKDNKKDNYELETEIKYNTYTPGTEYGSIVKQKDDQIKNLKNIINKITQSGRGRKENEIQDEELRNSIKVLTIENQKLVSVIEKMRKERVISENNTKFQQQYQNKIQQLNNKFNEQKKFHEDEKKQLRKFNKDLNIQLKTLQGEKRELENENNKLLKILKQKNDSSLKNSDKLKVSDASDQSNSNQQKTQNSSKNQEKLSLTKIREQHSQNLKMLKQGLIKQIEQTFDTMKIVLQEINSKVYSLSKRLEQLQKRSKRTQVETESITISIRERCSTTENQPQTDRSFKLQKKNNSEIYIEQGPSSSHDKASRDEFSRLQEVFSQKNLRNPLHDELSAVKAQLSELRFKYEKLCLDTSSVGFSQRVPVDELNELAQLSNRYQKTLKQLQEKQKETDYLYEEIKKISREHTNEQDEKNDIIKHISIQNEKMRRNQQSQIYSIKEQTELKVKMLIENYQRQIQLLKNQLLLKSNTLYDTNVQSTIEKQSSKKKLEQISAQMLTKQQQNKQILQKMKFIEQEYSNAQITWMNLQNKIQNQINILQENAENNRKMKQQIQQKLTTQISQLNQNKTQIQSLRLQLIDKNENISSLNSEKIQLKQSITQIQQKFNKISNIIKQKDLLIDKLKQKMTEWNNSSILGQIDELKILIQKSQIDVNIKQNNDVQIQQKIDEISELRKNSQILRQHLEQKQTLIVHLQSRILQLQKISKISSQKLLAQYSLYNELVDKLTSLQKYSAIITEQKEYRHKYKQEQITIVNKKLLQIQQFEQQRFKAMRQLLDQNSNIEQF